MSISSKSDSKNYLTGIKDVDREILLNIDDDRKFLELWFLGLISILCIALVFYVSGELTFDGRLQGPFTSPNFLAFFLFPGSLMSFYFWKNVTLIREILMNLITIFLIL